MDYSVSKVIRKVIGKKDVFDVLREKFSKAGEISEINDVLTVTGLNKNLGGINYKICADFSISGRDEKTIINVDVVHKTSVMFWVLVVITTVTLWVGALIPIGFYFYGKNLVIKELERGLLATAEELE